MRFLEIRVQQFRNIDFAAIPLTSNTFFLGQNGQGKTNILEALGYITAFRSFRSYAGDVLIQDGKLEASILYRIEHETEGECTIRIDMAKGHKKLFFNQTPLTQVSQLIGKFPTVTFSSEDIQLVRNLPTLRRRFLDLTLSATDPAYLAALIRFHKVLKARSVLLRKWHNSSLQELSAFDEVLAIEGSRIYQKRLEAIPELSGLLTHYYNRIAVVQDFPELVYHPNAIIPTEITYLDLLKQNRDRDIIRVTTSKGPQRDDIDFCIKGLPAREYASEGQQRSLVIALKLAQAAYFEKKSHLSPVILADDILGQLDSSRRKAFWSALNPSHQIICTGTQSIFHSQGANWQVYEVNAGTYLKAEKTE